MSELFAEDFGANLELDVEDNSDEELTDKELRTRLQAMEDVLRDLVNKAENHTTAVNQFGGMLDYVVKSVASFGEAIQKDGIMGLMKSAMGGKK